MQKSVLCSVLGSVFVTLFSTSASAALQCTDIFLLEEMPTTIFPVAAVTFENNFHSKLGAKLQEHNSKVISQREMLADTAERLFTIERNVALKTGAEIGPEMRPESMQLLLSVYGINSKYSLKERTEFAKTIEEALGLDPYFVWLTEKVKISGEAANTQGTPAALKTPVEFLLSNLNGDGSLPLSVALWRLRSEMDPTLHTGTRSAVRTLLSLYRQEVGLGQLIKDFQGMSPTGPQGYVWTYAKGLEHAKQSREELLTKIRERAGGNLSLRQFESLQSDVSYEVVLLRQYFEAKEGQRLEALLMALNTIIDVAQRVDDANIFR